MREPKSDSSEPNAALFNIVRNESGESLYAGRRAPKFAPESTPSSEVAALPSCNVPAAMHALSSQNSRLPASQRELGAAKERGAQPLQPLPVTGQPLPRPSPQSDAPQHTRSVTSIGSTGVQQRQKKRSFDLAAMTQMTMDAAGSSSDSD